MVSFSLGIFIYFSPLATFWRQGSSKDSHYNTNFLNNWSYWNDSLGWMYNATPSGHCYFPINEIVEPWWPYSAWEVQWNGISKGLSVGYLSFPVKPRTSPVTILYKTGFFSFDDIWTQEITGNEFSENSKIFPVLQLWLIIPSFKNFNFCQD